MLRIDTEHYVAISYACMYKGVMQFDYDEGTKALKPFRLSSQPRSGLNKLSFFRLDPSWYFQKIPKSIGEKL